MGVDRIYIGDPVLSERHFDFFQNFVQEVTILLKGADMTCCFDDLDEYFCRGDKLWNGIHQPSIENRSDGARLFIRLEKSRALFAEKAFKKQATNPQQIGTVTIDNKNDGCYQGEICVVKNPLPTDEKATLIAKIDHDFVDCLPFTGSGQKIKLQLRKF